MPDLYDDKLQPARGLAQIVILQQKSRSTTETIPLLSSLVLVTETVIICISGNMPRDLFSSEPPKEEALVASPESQTPRASDDSDGTSNATGENGYNEFTIHRDETRQANIPNLHNGRTKAKQMNDLHPYVQTLSISNVEECLALENAVFPENERCSRDKFIYRLTVCPELCLGLFTTRSSPPTASTASIYEAAHPPDSATPNLKSVLIAMVIATKIAPPAVTDEAMEIPQGWQNATSPTTGTQGHQENGRTIAIHSLGVLPAYQGQGLAKMIMKSYEQRMETSGIADRIALLAHDPLVKMYEGLGFESRGKSNVKFGGGGWNDLRYEFAEHGPGS